MSEHTKTTICREHFFLFTISTNGVVRDEHNDYV